MGLPYRKALVIGATSGIGRQLAETILAQSSTAVVLVGRRQDRLEALIKASPEGRADTIAFDISNIHKIPAFVQDVTNKHPDIDCIFLNAGVQYVMDFSKPWTVDLQDVEGEINVNYLSLVALTRCLLPKLLQIGQGRETALIYTTSSLMMVPYPMTPNYCASKAALRSFILSLREQLKRNTTQKVNVIELVAPLVQTELHDEQPGWTAEMQPGMPVKDFVAAALAGIASNEESIAIGAAKSMFDELESGKGPKVSMVWDRIKKTIGEKTHTVT